MKRLVRWVACVALGSLVPVTSRAAAPTSDEVRQAVTRSLPFLEAEGVAWMRGKACATCHQIPSMVWSFNEAQRRGFPVDASSLAQWNTWAVDNALKRAVYFKLADENFQQLMDQGLAEAEVSKLKALKDRNYVFEADFRAALAGTIAADKLGESADVLLKTAAKPGQGGTGGGENNQFTAVLLSGAADGSADAATLRSELMTRLVKAQNKDGSWSAAGQFRGQQRPKTESTEVATLWTVWALTQIPEPSADAKQAMATAREYLRKASAETNNIETMLLRGLLAVKEGDEARGQQWISDVLAHQHEDGGWGWLKDRPASDPFTTGLVLYGLSYLGHGAADPAVAKAHVYLLTTQDESGAWKIGSKTISANSKEDTKAGDAIYTYWATGWAVVGLLTTLDN
jgi:squalene-hopene/tetraprenyl-beta-curcumene cyclase